MANVLKRNSAVSNRNSSQADSDNDLVEPENNVVEFVSLEGLFILFDNSMEIFEFSFKHDLNQFVVRIGVLEVKEVCKDLSVGYLAL